jgi:hypothetical protein
MPDFTVRNEGTILLFYPLTDPAREWLKENVQDDAQWFGDALVVEHRYAGDLAMAMLAAGLTA